MDMNINGDLVKELRLKRSWSQEQLAEAAGVSLRTVQRAETDSVVSLKSRAAVAKALEVAPPDLDPAEELSEIQDSVAIDPAELPGKSKATLVWHNYLSPTLRVSAVATLWIGMAAFAWLILVTLIGGIFLWEATSLSFWGSAGTAIVAASIFVPPYLIFLVLYRKLKSRTNPRHGFNAS